MEKFAIGLLVGGLGGALLVANNYKMCTLVKKGQEEVQTKLDQLMDDKIQAMEEGTGKIKEMVKEKAEETLDDVKKGAKKAVKKSRAVIKKATAPKPAAAEN